MSQVARDRRLVEIPQEQRAYVQELVERVGIVRATEILNLGRTAVLGIAARGWAMAGTAALLREAYRRRNEAA
jgi:hypothetical protein